MEEDLAKHFDSDVKRFTNLATGQASFVDSTVILEEFAFTAKTLKPEAKTLLDIGTGGGNQTLNLLNVLPQLECTAIDVSPKMLEAARERIGQVCKSVNVIEGDVRNVCLQSGKYDLVTASAVLHHLRGTDEWLDVYAKIFDAMAPGGLLLISDFICYDNSDIQKGQMERYKNFLYEKLGDAEAERILKSIAETDTPRSMEWQLEIMQKAGFANITVLHKNMLFGAWYAVKPAL